MGKSSAKLGMGPQQGRHPNLGAPIPSTGSTPAEAQACDPEGAQGTWERVGSRAKGVS